MLYFLLSWCLLVGVTFPLGAVVFADLAPQFPDRLLDRILIALWLGTGVTAIVLLLVSYVTPLSPVVGLALFVTVAIRGGLQMTELWEAIVPSSGETNGVLRTDRSAERLVKRSAKASSFGDLFKSHGSTLLGIGLVAVGLAAWLDRPVTWNDTGYYHASLIQWLGTYGTVPGLALLFNNLGFTSAWFALAAPFNPVILAGKTLAVTNGFAALLLLAQWSIGVRSLRHPHPRLADYYSVVWGSLLIPVMLFLKPLSEILVSPSPDLAVTILVGTIGWVMLLVGEKPIRMGDNRDRLIPLMLAVMAVSFKLIALPLLPITLLFALWRQPGKVWLTTGLIALAGLFPMIIGNLITSGCPLYPSNVLCVNLPWSPTDSAIAQVATGTHGWTTWYGIAPPGTNPWLWSLGQWWATSGKEKITAIGILLGLFSVAVVVGRELLKGGGKRILRQLDDRPVLWVSLLGLLGIGFIMMTSPFFRFSASYILTLLSISTAVLWSKLASKLASQGSPKLRSRFQSNASSPQNWGARGAIPIALALVTLCLILHRSTLLLPPPMVFASTWVTRTTNGIQYFAPQSGDVNQDTVKHKDMCWNAPIPCAYDISPAVHLRDPDRGLAGGFIRKRT